jgi:antirestriction protein ArdC
MNTKDIYERITNIIIEMLENHKANNFSQSWYNLSGDSVFAKNIVSNHVYNGINQLLLNYLKSKYHFGFNRWLTFKQLSELNGKIKKGSKAAIVVFKSAMYFDENSEKNITKLVEHLQKNNQSTEHLKMKKVSYLKYFNVFNVSQVDNLPEDYYKIQEIEHLTEFEKDERAELVINNSKAVIEYAPSNDAFYNWALDKIYMPERKQFVSKEAFYNVLFHEMGHWTGNTSRLDRKHNGKFGSKEYAFEELVAEINAAYLCAMLGYENRITDNVNYIDNWLSVMRNDKKFIIQASSQAQQSADFILEKSKITKQVI